MSQRSKRNRKPKLTLRPEAIAWLAAKCADQEFTRILALYDRGEIEAVLLYLKSITSPDIFKEFEDANLPPDVLAARRKAEAERIQKEETEKRTIHLDGVPKPTTADIVEGKGGWRNASLTAAEREALAKAAREDALGMVESPKEEF